MNGAGAPFAGGNDPYRKSASSYGKGTYVEGMAQNAPGVDPMGAGPVAPEAGKPVVGFLYSVSRMGVGEFWPLHIGVNTIGRGASADVRLLEQTVSEMHAEIVVRKMKNPEKLIASITDARSTCGTMVNDESLAFSSRECFNNDIITVGESYRLLLILIDTKELGLSVAETFRPVEEAGMNDMPPFMGGAQPFTAPYAPGAPGTEAMDGGYAGPQSGGTVGV